MEVDVGRLDFRRLGPKADPLTASMKDRLKPFSRLVEQIRFPPLRLGAGMKRRQFLGVLGCAVTWPVAARAQQKERVYRIGYLSAPSRESVQRILDAFLRKLRELGWVDGANLAIEYRWADGDIVRLPELAAELVRQNVDLIVAPNTASAVAAKNATSSIPIVFFFAGEPVQLNLVSSLQRPGGNVTGTSFTAGPGYAGKLLETLKQAVPAIIKVGVLSDRADQGAAYQVGDLQAGERR